MACIYNFLGHTFNSELELDQFLLDKAKYLNKYPDIVFNASSSQLELLSIIEKIAKDDEKAYAAWRRGHIKEGGKYYDESGEELEVYEYPYLGVNRFLGSIEKGVQNRRLIMEFRKDAFWSKKFKAWRDKQFTDYELDLFKLDKDNLPDITEEKLNQWKKDIEFNWQNRADAGSAVHDVMKLFFSEDESGEQVFNHANPLVYIKNHLDPRFSKYLKDDLIIQQIIDHAKELKSNLEQKLNIKPGEQLLFFPEFVISGEATHPDANIEQTLLGYCDLLVLDPDGNVHILDYKTSINDYNKFGNSKKQTYSYQLAMYQRILEKRGLNVGLSRLFVAPIKLENFHLVVNAPDDEQYEFDSISSPVMLADITADITPVQVANINNIMPKPFNITLTNEGILENVVKWMEACFPEYQSMKQVTEEQVIEWLKNKKLLEPDENGDYIYKPLNPKENPIISKDKKDFIDKVVKYRQSQIPLRQTLTKNVKYALKESISKGVDNVDWPHLSLNNTGASVTWLRNKMKQYEYSNWQVVECKNNDLLDEYGIILLQNPVTKQIDVIRITPAMINGYYRNGLDKKDPTRNRLGLTGNFVPDLVEQSNSNSLMLQAINGNIELAETMAVLNCINGLPKDSIIGNIQVLNPWDGNSSQVSNEEAMYSFNQLNKYKALGNGNKFSSGEIQMANKYRLVVDKFKDILFRAEYNKFEGEYRVFKEMGTCLTGLEELIANNADAQEKIKQLQELDQRLQADNVVHSKLKRIANSQEELVEDYTQLHNIITIAIAQLKGINFRQQIKDHNQWLEKSITKGIQGSYIDNPGNLSSQTLNLITEQVTNAYQNTRDQMQPVWKRIRDAVDKFKAAKGMGYIKENIGANQASLYKNLIEEVETEDGIDLMFKDINKVNDPAEKEFLTFTLNEINRFRFPKASKERLDSMRDSYDPEYYRLPLARGSMDSAISTKGLMGLLRSKLQNFSPKKWVQDMREKSEGLFNSETSVKNQKNTEELFSMNNMFEGSNDPEKRIRKIREKKPEYFEHNLETLLLKHSFAYIQQANVNSVFPLIKASAIHLQEQGFAQNDTFDKDLKYVEEYIRNKIKGQSIIGEELQLFAAIGNKIKKASSIFTLAFSPVQMIYQPLQGLWNDIRLMITQPDGKESFTFNNFKTALGIVYSDLLNFSGKPTLCSLFNQTYGLNDMDMNQYAERLSKGKKGIFNFENFAMKFSSRPDYYNRLSIFTSRMIADGCYDAHSIKDGMLHYDWTKDKRFELFAANPKSKSQDPEFLKQKSLYYTVAQQFVAEHAQVLNENGELVDFVLDMNNPMPLPKAYTTKESESIKSLSDDIYGYYSHEKKSLIMSTALGSMWLQFKTFWSGKKNQYLQPGGVRMRGTWEQASEKTADGTEVKYYYQVDSNGNPQYDKPPVTTKTSAPVMQWKGQWQEGIIMTIGDIARETLQDPKHFVQHFQNKWNNADEDLKRCYRANLNQLWYDLLMFFVIGSIVGGLLADWLKDLEKENKKNHDFLQGCATAGARVAVMSVKNSFMDFNFFESIGSPIGSWTPFAIEWTTRQTKNIYKVATGDEDIWDGALNVMSVGKQIRPIADSIKPDMFRTKQEGGTWESSTARKNREKRENA